MEACDSTDFGVSKPDELVRVRREISKDEAMRLTWMHVNYRRHLKSLNLAVDADVEAKDAECNFSEFATPYVNASRQNVKIVPRHLHLTHALLGKNRQQHGRSGGACQDGRCAHKL